MPFRGVDRRNRVLRRISGMISVSSTLAERRSLAVRLLTLSRPVRGGAGRDLGRAVGGALLVSLSRLVAYTTCFVCILLLPHQGFGQNVDDLVAQGKASRADGKKQKAIDAFQTVLDRAPEHVESLVQMGAAYEDLRQWRNAVRCYRRALKISPNNLVAARNLKQLRSSRVVNTPVEVPNSSGEHLIRRGLKAFQRGDLKGAFEVFRLCRGLLKDDPRPLLYSAIILERRGKVRSAIALYERTIEAFPEFAPARVNHVIALLVSGDRQTALRSAQASLEVLPGNVRLRYLARLCSNRKLERASTARSGIAVTENRTP